ELNSGNAADGLRRLELAALIQFTMPGAPMIYYGDEVGVTGDDDPDGRRTYPWPDLSGSIPEVPGRRINTELLADYQALAALRLSTPALTDGDLRFLLVGTDDEDTIAYGRRTSSDAAIIALNRSDQEQTVRIPVAGFAPDGSQFSLAYPRPFPPPFGGTDKVVTGNELTLTLPALSGVVLLSHGGDLMGPAAPTVLTAQPSPGPETALSWSASAGASGYNVYASPLSGGGYVRLNDGPITDTDYFGALTQNGPTYFVVTALDAAGNESGWSTEVTGVSTD
ncbi:MAG TPA: alpha-amylase family glycosyl hydrolase, partial [Candidatus Limnocylindrales bacterium]|nr:alpha-amylase family glycosyl hydrolase [Candidatus Limnocylindrales bacterium]